MSIDRLRFTSLQAPNQDFVMAETAVYIGQQLGLNTTFIQDSPYRTFADLQGCRWAYNEPNSHSGYNITR
jgi:ABC-type phosphate/phosphonate transport system substrate-binding protein